MAALCLVLAAAVSFESLLARLIPVSAAAAAFGRQFDSPPQVVVALLTDLEDLPRGSDSGPSIGDAWPLDYASYERFVVRAWCLGARSLYIDVGFSVDRVRYPTAKAELRTLEETIELLSDERSPTPRLVELRETHCPIGSAPRAVERMPIYVENPFGKGADEHFGGRQVSAIADKTIAPTDDSGFRAAAFAIADAGTCGDMGSSNAACRKIRRLEASNRVIEVRDSPLTPATQTKWTQGSQRQDPLVCAYQGDFFSSDFFKSIGYQTLEGPPKNWWQCPPLPMITWTAFLARDPQAVAALVSGKVVMLGTYISGTYDEVTTTFHYRMPGVFSHALAANDLLNGVDLWPQAPTVWQILFWSALFGFLVLFFQEWDLRHEDELRVACAPPSRRIWLPARSWIALFGAGTLFVVAFFFLDWKTIDAVRSSVIFFFCYDVTEGDHEAWDPVRLLMRVVRALRQETVQALMK